MKTLLEGLFQPIEKLIPIKGVDELEKFQTGVGQTFELDNKWLKFIGASNGYFKVPKSHIETVSISVINAGTSELRIIGKGAILASVSFPFQLPKQAQEWIIEKLNIV